MHRSSPRPLCPSFRKEERMHLSNTTGADVTGDKDTLSRKRERAGVRALGSPLPARCPLVLALSPIGGEGINSGYITQEYFA